MKAIAHAGGKTRGLLVAALVVVGASACTPGTLGEDAGARGGSPGFGGEGPGGASGTSGAVSDGGIDAPPALCPEQTGTFLRVSAGNRVGCAIRTDGTLTCWGAKYYAVPDPFPGQYTNVSAQGAICAVKSTGELACWGNESFFQPVPTGRFVDVAVGEEAACARRADKTVTCWGNPVRPYWVPPGRFYESLSGGAYFVCSLDASEHAAVCWDPRGSANPSDYSSVEVGPFSAVGAGRFYACGLQSADSNVACWSVVPIFADASNTYGQLEAAPGPFDKLAVGEFHACGLRSDGQAVCWGNNNYGQATPPAGVAFQLLSVGSSQTCGILKDGTLRCWGEGCASAPILPVP